MKKIRGILNLVIFALGTTLLYFQYLAQQNHRYFSSVAEKIENEYLHQQSEIDAFLDEYTPIIEKIVNKGFSGPSESLAIFPALQDISNQPFELFFLRNNELVLWNANTWIPPRDLLLQLNNNKEQWVQNNTGSWILSSQSLDCPQANCKIVRAVNIQRQFPIQGDFLSSDYPGIVIGPTPSEYPINGQITNSVLAYIQNSSSKLTSLSPEWLAGLLLLITLIGWIGIHNKIANIIAKKFHPIWGGAWIIGQIIILTHPVVRNLFFDQFGSLVLQTTAYLPLDSIMNLFDCIMGFWLMIFFHRNFGRLHPQNFNPTLQYIFTAGTYLVIAVVFLANSMLIKTLILEANTSFSLNILFRFELEAATTIAAILFLLFGLYLFTHRMMLNIIQLGLPSNHRLPILGGVILLVLPFYPMLNLGVGPLPLLLILLTYLSLFDLFADTTIRSLSWLSIWLIFFSAFPSFFLVKYNIEKSLNTAQELAKQLTGKTPGKLEKEFQKFADQWATITTQNQLKADSLLLSFPLLSNNFEMKFDSKSISNKTPSFRKIYTENHPLSYAVGQNILFTPAVEASKSVYHTLIQNSQLDVWKEMRNFDFAMAMGNSRIFIQGHPPQQLLIEAGELSAETFQKAVNSQRADLLYRTKDGTTIVIGQALKGYQQGFAIFSFFFILLTLILLIFATINSWVEAIPLNADRPIFSTPTLSNRIQLAFGSLILISFLVFGWYTVSFFNRAFQQDESKQLNELITTLKNDWESEPFEFDDATENKVMAFLERIRLKYQTDFTSWDREGHLNETSHYTLFNEGIKVDRMPSTAYFYFNNLGKEPIIIPQVTGEFYYQEAFLPLQKEETVLGYLGIPYFSGKAGLSNDIYDFFGTLLSFYVLFLLIAVGVVILLSQTITHPITRIANRLRTLSLNKKNEPLDWNRKDEIGILVNRYNEMIHELDEKANELKQSEREGAWRQMAKQVAHEIKNPLTPMKLSVQHLQRAVKANPQEMEQHINKVSQTIVEQIEGLAKIATEFSNFASMPKAINQVFELNACIQSVYDLHKNGTQMDISFELSLPDKHLYVNADKDQLIRVLQNLVTNAIQAIPLSGQGRITINLSQIESNAIIQVTDNGIGIPHNIQEMVFVPNFTTKSSGSGLGLAICKNIIIAAGGKINFQTKEGIGTTFTVQLPLVEISDTEK